MNSIQDKPFENDQPFQTVTIRLNGQLLEIPQGCSVSRLLELTEMRDQLVAVEVNLNVVPRSQHSLHSLRQGDEVEVVTLVGGG